MTPEFLENIQEEKKYIDKNIDFPMPNDAVQLSVKSVFSENEYIVDINRKQATLGRITYQDRYQKNIILLRLDIGTKPHRNPDGKILSGNHIHVYKNDYQDTVAYELDDPALKEINPAFDLQSFATDDIHHLFQAFSEFCNIINVPSYNHILI